MMPHAIMIIIAVILSMFAFHLHLISHRPLSRLSWRIRFRRILLLHPSMPRYVGAHRIIRCRRYSRRRDGTAADIDIGVHRHMRRRIAMDDSSGIGVTVYG